MSDPTRHPSDPSVSGIEQDPFTEAAENPERDIIDISPPPKRKTNKIETFEDRNTNEHHQWIRETQKTGTGATHVKTFYGKLKADSIHLMDDQINTWLDDNPKYEVKFSTSAIGVTCGKNHEPAIFVSVWV